MPSPPDFSVKTVRTLGARAGMICSNPNCSTLTVGPSDAKGDLKLKLGEAAHIIGARPGAARYSDDPEDDELASLSNGIWLCASCHTMIDKNDGVDFPVDDLHDWKDRHESIISSLLLTHRSPLPVLRQFTAEGEIAQQVVDELENHGALFVDHAYENPPDVEKSVERLRKTLISLNRKVRHDVELKNILKDIAAYCRDYMNHTSNFKHLKADELNTLRNRVGIRLKKLESDFGCTIRGPLRKIIP